MESKNERIKRIFPGLIKLADELYPVYMPTDENGHSGLDYTMLFGHSMKCFSFSTERLCYIAVYRKLFLTAFLILARDGLVNIDLSDIKNMEVDIYENMICLDRLEEEAALMDILIQRIFDAYGYHYETASYKIADLTSDLYDSGSEEEISEGLDENCRLYMQENDYLHTDVYSLFCRLCQTGWYGQEDLKVWRFSNSWLSKITDRDYSLAADSEKLVLDNTFRLDFLLFPDEVSYGVREYSRVTGEHEFAAVESAYVSSGWNGYYEYWCRLDTAFLNFGALLAIPYIDALMDDVSL